MIPTYFPRPVWKLCRLPAWAAFLLLAPAVGGQGGLTLEIREGAGAVVPAGQLSSRRFTVVVKAADGRPVQGATVHFRLPPEGPTGVFSSGLRTESTVTDAAGQAIVYGIQWGNVAGRLEIQVSAVLGGQKAAISIPVEISSRAPLSREDRSNPAFRTPSSGRKWLLWALVGAGAAAGASMASRNGGKPVSYEPPAAVVVPPSIGTPTITVGKP